MEKPADEVEMLQQMLDQAIRADGTFSAAAVFDALTREHFLQEIPHESNIVRALQQSLPNDEIMSARIGSAAFLGFACSKIGLSDAQIDTLGARWSSMSWEHTAKREREGATFAESATEIVQLAAAFFQDFMQQSVPEIEKPRQYYESIYADREAMFRHSPYALEERLSKAVMKGDEPLALVALREIRARGDKAVVARNPLRSSKNSIIGSIAFLARAAIQAGVGANDAFALSDALIQKTEDLSDREQVLAFEEQIVVQYINLVKRRLEETYSPVILRAIHYIENHLGAKVALTQTAQYAGVHPGYLSERFKKEVGTPFSQYVTNRRIQESCYFVRHTMYAISEIAVLYGYSSESYYIQRFKLVLGVTPTEYRKRGLAE